MSGPRIWKQAREGPRKIGTTEGTTTHRTAAVKTAFTGALQPFAPWCEAINPALPF